RRARRPRSVPSRKTPAPRRAAPARCNRRLATAGGRLKLSGSGSSFTRVAQFGFFGFRIDRGGRDALAILLERRRAPHRVGRALRPRLLEVGRVVDHGSEVALGGAAEIVILLVLVVAGVVDRRAEVGGPET